jgi:hypothetical protein
MNTLSGLSTSSTKRGAEGYLFVDPHQVHDVGRYESLGNGSGTYAEANDCLPAANDAPYVFAAGGEDLMARVDGVGLYSETAMVLTVTGTAVGGGALTGTATFPALAAQDTAMQIITAGGAKFASVTAVSSTYGVYGDGFEICTFPDYTKKTYLAYLKGINLDPGSEVLPVYDHYMLDHSKRGRRQGKLTIDRLYQNNQQGLSLVNNRFNHMIIEVRDNGQTAPTEVWIVDKTAGTAKKKFGDGDAETTETYDGFFGRCFIFS